MEHIIKNQARCLVCGDIIESEYTHHNKTCNCGNLSVDGGRDYIRRSYMTEEWEDLSEIEEE